MLRNFLAAALRHLGRNKFYTAISVGGLALGLWAALLSGLILHNQFSYDHFIPGYDRIYMAMSWVTPPGHATIYLASTNVFVAPELKSEFSELDAVTRLSLDSEATLRHGAIEAKEKIYWADPNAFEMLPLPTIAGDLKSALRRPDSIVLPRSVARKYFGRDAPVGETLLLDGGHPMVVSAVIEDLPVNGTHLQSGIFASGLTAWSRLSIEAAIRGNVKGSDVGFGTYTYLRLRPGASPKHLLAAMPTLARTLWKPPPKGFSLELHLLRMDRLNTNSGLNPGFAGRVTMILALGTVILLIASANFVNLLTARSALRATEVAIRKVSGIPRHILVLQFLGESLIYVMVAALVAAALTEWSLPFANAFLNTGATFNYWREHTLIGWIALAAVLLSLLAGAYPAFVLSSFRPLNVLTGAARHPGRGGLAQPILVTLQFAILIGLLVAAGVAYEQRIYATHEALRVNTDEMLLIRAPCSDAFTVELRKLPGVQGLACTSAGLLGGLNIYSAKDRTGALQFLANVPVEPGIFDLYRIPLLAGRIPAEGSTAQGAYAVVNETAARRLGFSSPQEAIGFGLTSDGTSRKILISGVIPDFSLGSVAQKIEGTVYQISSHGPDENLISIKLAGHDIPETLTAIDRLWAATGGKQPVVRFFLDQYLQDLYISVLHEAEACGIFSLVAVALACLGLLGLSASITERCSREIGIRKALGADTRDVLRLLLWQFSKPVVWANLIAWPVAGYVMSRWLAGFAYHISLPLWLFPVAAGVALLIALLTVSAHSIVVARARPISALRYE